MSANTIDAGLLGRMFLAGARNLEKSKEWINELNVFPVPDGDTGTNMTMTIQSAAAELKNVDASDMKQVCKAMSSGSLRGARGNSGVILSQLLRGFCKVLRDQSEVDTQMLNAAFQKSVETAYKAVMKPKEGTILTVARGFAEKASSLYEENPDIEMEAFLSGSLVYAEDVLARTPDMLPVLKEAGVVDSGGQGLIQILQGAFDLYTGKEDVLSEETEESVEEEPEELTGYCLRFRLKYDAGEGDAERTLLAWLNAEETVSGAVITREKDGLQLHAHLEKPWQLMEKAAAYGQLTDVHMTGMFEEACDALKSRTDGIGQGKCVLVLSEGTGDSAEGFSADIYVDGDVLPPAQAPEERKKVGFVAVAAGEGLCSIFRDLGVDQVIEGGQTMNPSTDDVVHAIRSANADAVFVFPNNKNIILAANQAKTMVEDVQVVVVPTKTVPQGISALISFMPEMSVEENEESMTAEINRVRTCQITYAVRDTHIGDQNIHEGDIMGVGDKGILAVGEDIAETSLEAVRAMTDEESELVSIYFGEDIREEDAETLADRVREACPDVEVELNAGGQPVYYYIISVE